MNKNNLTCIDLISMKISMLLCLSAIIVGHIVQIQFEFYNSIIGIFLSSFLSFFVCILMYFASNKYVGFSTIEIVKKTFEKNRIILCSLGLIIPMSGWIINNENLFSNSTTLSKLNIFSISFSFKKSAILLEIIKIILSVLNIMNIFIKAIYIIAIIAITATFIIFFSNLINKNKLTENNINKNNK